MKRLQTINESLQHRGQVNSVSAQLGMSVWIDESDGKVKTSVYGSTDTGKTAINESVDKVKSDKLDMLHKSVKAIIDDAKEKMEKALAKYEFNK